MEQVSDPRSISDERRRRGFVALHLGRVLGRSWWLIGGYEFIVLL
jgi:hypothetical protein